MVRAKEKKTLGDVFQEMFYKIFGKEEKKDVWARNLFSDLGRLKGKLIVMRMG